MTIEHAHACSLPKPWGVLNPSPWSNAGDGSNTIGEIRYERSEPTALPPSLLLKLLFTAQPLSIQVHPDDAYAHSTGLPNGKTEAWHILDAASEAKIGLGLKRRIPPRQLRLAIHDGSISDLLVWRPAQRGDTISVPAGTIHAIGAGLVVAEIQQRSDTTYRLFDHGRSRELHIEDALAVANAGPAEFAVTPTRLNDTRMLLVSNSHFTFERIDLPSNSTWYMEAEQETWLLVVSGSARTASFDVMKGDAIFSQSDQVALHAGKNGLRGLVAYTGPLVRQLLKHDDTETIQ